jgi:hypothetical protein
LRRRLDSREPVCGLAATISFVRSPAISGAGV